MHIPSSLVLKESPIHGLGIFAAKDLPPNTKLGFFEGDKYTYKEFKEKYGADITYCFTAKRHNYILCAKETRNFITYINEQQEPNVALIKRNLTTLRSISKGEELFLHYGPKYPRDYSLTSQSKETTMG